MIWKKMENLNMSEYDRSPRSLWGGQSTLRVPSVGSNHDGRKHRGEKRRNQMYRMRIQSFKEDETASSKESSRKMI